MIKTRIVCTTHDLDKTVLISIRKNPKLLCVQDFVGRNGVEVRYP